MSLAILTDEDEDFRPTSFQIEEMGIKIEAEKEIEKKKLEAQKELLEEATLAANDEQALTEPKEPAPKGKTSKTPCVDKKQTSPKSKTSKTPCVDKKQTSPKGKTKNSRGKLVEKKHQAKTLKAKRTTKSKRDTVRSNKKTVIKKSHKKNYARRFLS